MSKAVLLIACLVAVTLSISPFDKVKEMVSKDQCGIHGLETVRPKLENKIQELKADPLNMQAKLELLALIDSVKDVYDTCKIHEKVQPAVGDAIEAAGIAFLLASNCFKDVGAILLIGDSIIKDPSSLTADIIILIILYILGRQGYADCEQFIGFII